MINVCMVQLGCPKNLVDGEIMINDLMQGGFHVTSDLENAQVAIINTCGFIESAKQEAIENILEVAKLKESGSLEKLIVAGCMAQRYPQEILKQMPEVDGVLGLAHNKDIASFINELLETDEKKCSYSEFDKLLIEGERQVSTPKHTAYLKIADGCDNFCSYCAIPKIRGRFISRSIEDVLAEANSLVSAGVREIILIAQDTTKYGLDLYGEYKLSSLLTEMSKLDGILWIRMLYCYPELIDDKLLKVMAENDKIVPYIDMPLQHADKRIIRKMNRIIAGDEATALVKKIRKTVPGVELRTTMLVGFPGETEDEFEYLTRFVKENKFEKLGCFAFSPEDGTPAYDMENQNDLEVSAARAEHIMLIQQDIALNCAAAKVGRKLTAVCEGLKDGVYFGRTCLDAPDIDTVVYFSGTDLSVGTFYNIIITDTVGIDLVCEVLSIKE